MNLNKPKGKNPFISLVIANYNGEEYLAACLTSLLKSEVTNYEILIIDNNSTDNSIEIASEFKRADSRIRIFRNKSNLGVPFSRNKAIKKASGDILIFLDNDIEVDKNWLTGIIETFSSDETIGAMQCKIFDFDHREVIQEIGMKLYPFTGFGTPLGRGEMNDGKFDEPQDIIALGAALAVNKKIAVKINGFDQKLYHVTDDLDFSWRIWILGYRVVLSPKAIVYHYTKRHGSNYKLYFHLTKNSLRMITKNYEMINVIKFLPGSLAFNSFGAIYVLLSKRSLAGLIGVILGIVWYFCTLPDTLRERSGVQRLRRVKDDDIFHKIMIPTNIFSVLKRYYKIAKISVNHTEGIQ